MNPKSILEYVRFSSQIVEAEKPSASAPNVPASQEPVSQMKKKTKNPFDINPDQVSEDEKVEARRDGDDKSVSNKSGEKTETEEEDILQSDGEEFVESYSNGGGDDDMRDHYSEGND